MSEIEEAYIAFCKSHDGNWSARDLFNGGYQSALASQSAELSSNPLQLPSQAQQPTDLSKQLREYAGDSGYSHNDYADTMLSAASEIERCAAILAASQSQQPTKLVFDSESARQFLLENVLPKFSDSTFQKYVLEELAGDFAYQLVMYLQSQAQQKILKVSANWREPLSADAMQRLKNLGVLDKSPAPEGVDK